MRSGILGAARTVAVAIIATAFGVVDHAAANSPAKPSTASMKNGSSVSFKPVNYAELPSWASDDHGAALKAFLKSCSRILELVRAGPVSGKMVPPTPEFLSVCDEASRLRGSEIGPSAKSFFERNFVPHAVAHAGSEGLLTGYYEPLLDGSRVPQGPYLTPIYRRPPDLVNMVDETQRGARNGALTHARKTDKGVEPFPTRAEIEQGALAGKGLELLYFADPVDVFFMQIQGSARVKLTDGSIIRISYDGKNGHPYSSIGRYLVDQGIVAADKMSLDALAAWLRADTERGRELMRRNASYIFFRELAGEEAKGALGTVEIPLTPGRSLAVDAGHHAIGLPVYVSAPTLTHADKRHGFHRLMIAQDVGSAIRGPERGDIFFGSGAQAGKLAGVTKHPGKFYVLLPHPAPTPKPRTTKVEP